MSEPVLVSIIGLLGVLLGGGIVTAIVAWRKSKTEIKVLDTQGTANIAKALSDATAAMSAILNASEADRVEAVADRKTLETRVDELEAHRALRSREIYALQQSFEKLSHDYEKLNRDYAAETGKLRAEIDTLRKQVAEGAEKNRTYRQLIERLVQILQRVDPHLLEGIELTDTLEKIKAMNK